MFISNAATARVEEVLCTSERGSLFHDLLGASPRVSDFVASSRSGYVYFQARQPACGLSRSGKSLGFSYCFSSHFFAYLLSNSLSGDCRVLYNERKYRFCIEYEKLIWGYVEPKSTVFCTVRHVIL